ncbi:MAG: UxaA family hydrolase, partial [Saprospiraceae bacterium]|nr:UxaA family hydrolase [Saprospiraceae bacterium]
PINIASHDYIWQEPDVAAFKDRTFQGYHRSDGKVGTRNYWLFIPLVFCENRNIKLLQDTLLEPLGYFQGKEKRIRIDNLISAVKDGRSNFMDLNLETGKSTTGSRVFKNIDGIKFLTHEGGCGGTRQDSEMLCKLLASYIVHPNCGGATVLSLGCQNAETRILQQFIQEFTPNLDKPVYYFEQQTGGTETEFIEKIIKQTFEGLHIANQTTRKPAALSHLTLGLECGGSDGFSGLSANPALGYCADMLVALKGSAILSEFPELHGAEQDLVNRSVDEDTANRFLKLMQNYNARAKADGSGFEANPSPGNIRDGLITDAIKSLGAAKKGGNSPVQGVLDYGEILSKSGLNLLCTPGNDVESTTGLAGAGSTMIVFTTGLGTPTGNAITPTIKMATNSTLAKRMKDIIDINAGTIIEGTDTLATKAHELLEMIIEVASGTHLTSAEKLSQDDFIPWKRGISL